MSNILNSDYKRESSISSNISQVKTLEDLDMIDSFLFEGATESIEDAKLIAGIIIKRVTGHTVENLIVETEKQLKGISLNRRGIRMDILATEKEAEKTLRIYDIEPNKYHEENIPRRSRFYQSLIDSKLLSSEGKFRELPDSLSIWILPYDPFGEDRMLYTIKNMVVENNQIVYNDGVTKIFLYTKGTKGGSQKLKELLTFIEDTTSANAVDKELSAIQQIVDKIKSKSDVKERYMTLQEVIDYEKRDSYDEGIKLGRSEGIELGRSEGIELGRSEGIELGRSEGIELGRSEGIELGRSEGIELGRSEGIELGRSEGICAIIDMCKLFKQNRMQTKFRIIAQFKLTEEKADEYINLYW